MCAFVITPRAAQPLAEERPGCAGHVSCWERHFIILTPIAARDPDLPFTLRRRQFPMLLAFGMTSNKTQGQNAR